MKEEKRIDEQAQSNRGEDGGQLDSQENWAKWERKKSTERVHVGYEYPLYTDSSIVGERTEGLGPFSVLLSKLMGIFLCREKSLFMAMRPWVPDLLSPTC